MDNTTAIKEKVFKIVSAHLYTRIEEISLIDRLIKDLNADSLDIVELLISIEEGFSIEITDDEAEDLFINDKTVEDLINLVTKKLE